MQDRRGFLKAVATASVGVVIAPGEIIGKEKGLDVPSPASDEAILKGNESLKALGTEDPVLNKIRQARYVAAPSSVKAASLGILHYSDIHGDNIAVARIHDLIGKYGHYIDAVLATGDSVLYYADGTKEYPNDAKWWRASGLAEKSLFVLGNHDSAARSNEKGHLEGSADWDFKGKEWDFDTYYADYIDKLGYVMPKGYDNPSSPYYKSCFWHKDFSNAKIRLEGVRLNIGPDRTVICKIHQPRFSVLVSRIERQTSVAFDLIAVASLLIQLVIRLHQRDGSL